MLPSWNPFFRSLTCADSIRVGVSVGCVSPSASADPVFARPAAQGEVQLNTLVAVVALFPEECMQHVRLCVCLSAVCGTSSCPSTFVGDVFHANSFFPFRRLRQEYLALYSRDEHSTTVHLDIYQQCITMTTSSVFTYGRSMASTAPWRGVCLAVAPEPHLLRATEEGMRQ